MLALHHKMSLTVAAGVSSLCLSFFLSGFIPKWENQFENKNELCFLIMVSGMGSSLLGKTGSGIANKE